MFREICGVLVFTFLIHGGHGQSTLPSGIVRCVYPDDPCMIRQMQSILDVLRSDPALLNVETLQPLTDEWRLIPGKALNFEQDYKNIKLYNHQFSKIIEADVIHSESPVFIFFFYNPELAFVADYEFKNASFFGVSVTSKGKMLYREQGVHGYVNISTSFVYYNDKKHLKVDDVYVARNPARAVFEISTGDALTDGRIRDVLNHNWAAVLEDVGENYQDFYAVFYKAIMQSIFQQFPYEELFLNIK